MEILNKKSFRRWIRGLGLFYILNNFILPLGTVTLSNYLPTKFEKPKIESVSCPDCDNLDYLNLSNEIVHMNYQRKTDKKGADCKDYSIETFNSFMKILGINNKTDLSKTVRIVSGEVKIPIYGQKGAHRWLEILVDGTWIPYETTFQRDIFSGRNSNLGVAYPVSKSIVTIPGTRVGVPYGFNLLNPLKDGCMFALVSEGYKSFRKSLRKDDALSQN